MAPLYTCWDENPTLLCEKLHSTTGHGLGSLWVKCLSSWCNIFQPMFVSPTVVCKTPFLVQHISVHACPPAVVCKAPYLVQHISVLSPLQWSVKYPSYCNIFQPMLVSPALVIKEPFLVQHISAHVCPPWSGLKVISLIRHPSCSAERYNRRTESYNRCRRTIPDDSASVFTHSSNQFPDGRTLCASVLTIIHS